MFELLKQMNTSKQSTALPFLERMAGPGHLCDAVLPGRGLSLLFSPLRGTYPFLLILDEDSRPHTPK